MYDSSKFFADAKFWSNDSDMLVKAVRRPLRMNHSKRFRNPPLCQIIPCASVMLPVRLERRYFIVEDKSLCDIVCTRLVR